MNKFDDKINKLKEKIEAIDNNKIKKSRSNKENLNDIKKRIEAHEDKKFQKNGGIDKKGASFGFKISTELIAALIVGVGMGLIVHN